jgi:phosphatidate phosphatase PAH1
MWIQTGTAAAAAAGFSVGSTIAYVAPHMAGAIDVIVVRQPDGSLKSSPFYGKDAALRFVWSSCKISDFKDGATNCG